MKKCFPKCGGGGSKSSSDSKGDKAPVLESEMTQVCNKCKSTQSVARDATVFVCTNCHSVNRLMEAAAATVVSAVESPPSPRLISLRRINSSTFMPLSDAPANKTEVSGSIPIGPCSICLDAPGDMIFLQCNHGGFCEACARHIAGNNAVGGAFCVKCRSPIEKVVRIVELENDLVKAVEVSVQTEGDAKKEPPKVPPPRGFNKAKKR